MLVLDWLGQLLAEDTLLLLYWSRNYLTYQVPLINLLARYAMRFTFLIICLCIWFALSCGLMFLLTRLAFFFLYSFGIYRELKLYYCCRPSSFKRTRGLIHLDLHCETRFIICFCYWASEFIILYHRKDLKKNSNWEHPHILSLCEYQNLFAKLLI